MRQIAEEKLLPADIDAQPPVRAAAALRSVIRGYRDEIEREQRLPKALVEQFHAAGFYSLVIPRELGGLQADPLTYVRVVELLAEAAGSVGWNLANNSIGQLVTLGLPDEGFVFCSFNQSYKITPEVFDCWMRLLAEVEGSVLWLLDLNPDATRAVSAMTRQCSPLASVPRWP